MSEWWDGLTALQQFFYCVALPATLFMLIQTVLMIIGLGGHGDLAGHGPIDGTVGHDIPSDAVVTGHSDLAHGAPATAAHGPATAGQTGQEGVASDASDLVSFRLFTSQSILAFLVVFGWAGVALSAGHVIPGILAVLVALIAGTAALVLTAWMFYGLMKLQNSGNVRLAGAVGHEGEVYIPIPPNGQGQGKVNLLLQGRWIECDAVAAGPAALRTGQPVRVIGLQGGSILVVEPIIHK